MIVTQLSDSSVQRKSVSEDRGEFRIDDLVPGTYIVTINAAALPPRPRRRAPHDYQEAKEKRD